MVIINTINRNQFVVVVIFDNGSNMVFIVLLKFFSNNNAVATWASCDASFAFCAASSFAFFSCDSFSFFAASSFAFFSCADLFTASSDSFICWVNLSISSDTDDISFKVFVIFFSVLTKLDCKICISSSSCLLLS
jgi:hypothetical protein